jgi:hypothetical protein
MSYTYNKPDATDTMSASQAVLKDNFTALKSFLDVNHVTFGLTSQGKHNIVTIPQITVAAGSIPVAVSTQEWAFYVNDATSDLYLRHDKTAGTVLGDFNITGGTFGTTGICTLPCGLIIQWGTSSLGSGSDTVTITFAVPYTSACYNVQISPIALPSGDIRDAVIAASGIIPTEFMAIRSSTYKGASVSFNWLAIGKNA